MADLRQAAQQALEALDCINSPLYVREINKVGAAMSALRAALAEPARTRAKAIQDMVATSERAGLYELTAEPVAQTEPFEPNTGCKTPRKCRKEGFCMDGWHCASHALGIKDEK